MSFVDARKLIAGANPFIGLRPFGTADADVFFGRETQVATVLERLRDARFLAVVGASGCGKSSLVLAGVIPALERGDLEGAGAAWRVAVMRPGTSPVEALATVLARTQVLGEQSDDPDLPRARMLAALQRGERGLVDFVATAKLRDDEHLLIVVDQFEELFRYASNADPAAQAREAAAFVKLLLTAAWPDLPVYVTITLRGLHRRLRAVPPPPRSDQRRRVPRAAPHARGAAAVDRRPGAAPRRAHHAAARHARADRRQIGCRPVARARARADAHVGRVGTRSRTGRAARRAAL